MYQLNTAEIKLGSIINQGGKAVVKIEAPMTKGTVLETIEECLYLNADNVVSKGTIEVVEDGGKVGLGVKGAGKVAKYPVNNFLDFVNSTFTSAQKQLFTKAENFYKSFNPSFNVNELRGIDFDLPVTNVIKQENNLMYQMVTLDPVTGNPRFGSYFFENINEDITKLGIGDLNRIKADGRVKVKIVLDGEVDFLKSKTTNIEDWTGSGSVFDGGGNQFYNPTGRNKIKSYEIIETY